LATLPDLELIRNRFGPDTYRQELEAGEAGSQRGVGLIPSPLLRGPGSPGAEAALGVGALPPCAPPPGWRQGTVLPNSSGSPSERKIVRLLLDPGLQSIHSRAWKFILRNPDAAGGASEQHCTDAFLFGT